ncbi:HIT family protein [Pontiellaceae bacterium B12227]|nr:HIT family protein [Pontiellaceae bacterium B12227]
MNNCIFCKIIQKEIPATVIYEDDDVLAFMDIGPIIKGHALVIPKKHYDPITETPDEIIAKLHITAKKIATAQMNAFGADGVNILQNNGRASGQEVEHIHVHIIPRFENDGHHWNWKPKTYENFDEMNELAGKLQEQL